MEPLQLAKQVYGELIERFNYGTRNPQEYISITEKYVTLLVSGKYHGHFIWGLNGKQYTMYQRFNHETAFWMFCEDVAMMVYRLNGGEGYNTYTLMDVINADLKKEV